MTIARNQQISLNNTRYYHCISRCVRRAFLCGFDPLTRKNFDHRKGWIVQRIYELSTVFAIRVCAYSIMENHIHLVIYVDTDLVDNLTDREVSERWGKIFKRKTAPSSVSEENKIAVWRNRLTDISWYMRCLNEYVARQANKEDGCKGRFWEGRFKSQALMDESVLLACMVYVDLNPVRAKRVKTPEESTFTSIRERIDAYQKQIGTQQHKINCKQPGSGQSFTPPQPAKTDDPSSIGLMEFCSPQYADQINDRFSSNTYLPISFDDYLNLLDTTGRTVRLDKKGAIPAHIAPILERLAVRPQGWLKSVTQFEKCFSRVAGKVSVLKQLGKEWDVRWLKGQQAAADLYLTPM